MKSIKTISITMIIFAIALMGTIGLNIKPSQAQYSDSQLIYANGLYYLCPINHRANYWNRNLSRCTLISGYYNNYYYGNGHRYRDRNDYDQHRGDRGNRGTGNDNRGTGNNRGTGTTNRGK